MNSLVLANISFLSILPALLLFLRKPSIRKEVRLLALLLLISFLSDLICFILIRTPYHNTHPVTNVFFIIHFFLLYRLYSSTPPGVPKPFSYLFYGLLAFYIYNFFFLQKMTTFNSYSVTTASVFLIFLTLNYFYWLIIKLPAPFIHRVPMVWINIGILIYSAGNLFVFMLNNFFAESVTIIWSIHNVLNIFKNAIYFTAIWQDQRRINSSY